MSRKDKNRFESLWAETSRKRELDTEEAGNGWLEAGQRPGKAEPGHGCNPGGPHVHRSDYQDFSFISTSEFEKIHYVFKERDPLTRWDSS